MSGIISPSPEGCLVGVYGHDGTQWVRVAVDASGNIAISADSLPLPAGASTESTLNALYNTLTAKNLMLYNSLYSYGTTASGSSGPLTVDTSVVPSDKILVITSCGLLLAAGSASFLQLAISDGTNVRPFIRKLSPLTAEMLTCPPFVIVPPGGFIRGTAGSVGSGTSLSIFIIGYYVKSN